MSRIITLTTDFGHRDAYVASLKGAILSIASPSVRLVDVSHDVSPQDIMEAGFILRSAIPFFPDGTIHLVVVDPGVGTDRRPIAVRQGNHFFIGPDNGLLALTMNSDTPDEAVVLDRPHYWLNRQLSDTFHGRDIFAPVAAHLSSGVTLEEVGTSIPSIKPLHWALPIADEQGVQGWVVHIDNFGNCITNISRDLIEPALLGRRIKCYVGNAILTGIRRAYGDVAAAEPLVLFDSNGFLEIAVSSGNASTLLDIRKGAPVNLLFVDEKQEGHLVRQGQAAQQT